jgi:hypothetical protein
MRPDGPALRLEMHRLLVVLAACGGAAPPTIANHAQPTQLTCDDATTTRMESLVRKRWQIPSQHGLLVRCAAGTFNAHGFFIAVDGPNLHRTGIVDPSGAELVPFVDETEPDFGCSVTNYQTADLDGDGEDEIIESWHKSSPFAPRSDSWLVVRVVDGRHMRTIKGPYLSRYHPDLGGCNSTWELRRNSIRIAVEVSAGIPPTDCLPAGTHTFALRGHALVDHTSRPR